MSDAKRAADEQRYRLHGGPMPAHMRDALIIPTLNLNGTSKQSLLEDYSDTLTRLREAEKALRAMSPHGRDYIGEPEHMRAAVLQSARWQSQLRIIYDEIEAVALRVQQSGGGR